MNNGGAGELGITDGYNIDILDVTHPVLDGINPATDDFIYKRDCDTTLFLSDPDATVLATASRVSGTPYPLLIGGPSIVVYEPPSLGKIVVIDLTFAPPAPDGIPSATAKLLLENSIEWVR